MSGYDSDFDDAMDIKPYKLPHPLAFPLPLYESVPIAEATAKDGESFMIVAGLDKHMAEQVKQYSLNEHDPELIENTSDKKRFGEGSYEEWYSKQRTPFALIHSDTETVTAICWFGPKAFGRKSMKYLSAEELKDEFTPAEGEWHTISYRSYNPFRGKGLMRGFVDYVTKEYIKGFPNAKIWAIINTSNPASLILAEKLGYKTEEDASHPEEHLAVMVRH